MITSMEKITKKRMYLETGKSSKILLALCKKPAPKGEAYILKGSSDLVLCPGVGPAILYSLSAAMSWAKTADHMDRPASQSAKNQLVLRGLSSACEYYLFSGNGV
jgi:hypothetical protein